MIIETFNISGITQVSFAIHNDYIWIRNKSDDSIYASHSSSVTAGASGTTEIPSGEAGMIMMPDNNTIYISGSGSVEIKASDFAECPFKAAGKGGGSGTGNYADLVNKPMINDVILNGNKSFADLGLNTVNEPTVREIADGIAAIWG